MEAETFRKAQNKVRKECEGEISAYIQDVLDFNLDNGYCIEMGPGKKIGIWRMKGLGKPDPNGRQEALKGSAVLVFSDFTAVPK